MEETLDKSLDDVADLPTEELHEAGTLCPSDVTEDKIQESQEANFTQFDQKVDESWQDQMETESDQCLGLKENALVQAKGSCTSQDDGTQIGLSMDSDAATAKPVSVDEGAMVSSPSELDGVCEPSVEPEGMETQTSDVVSEPDISSVDGHQIESQHDGDDVELDTVLAPATSHQSHSCGQAMTTQHVQQEDQCDGDDTDTAPTAAEQPRALRHGRSTSEITLSMAKRRSRTKDQGAGTPKTSRGRSKSSPQEDESETMSKKRRLLPRRPGIEWEVGSRLQAMDFQKKWYRAKIIDVNPREPKVLIHFEGWSARFDEWLDMRSERLWALPQESKPAAAHLKQSSTQQKDVAVGMVVLAKWLKNAKSSKYPAIVKGIPSKNKISIQFYDGVETETDLHDVELLEHSLQKEALHMWGVMNELAMGSTTEQTTDTGESKVSRRQSIESARTQQAKVDAAEVLLSKFIESAKPNVEKAERRIALPEITATPPIEKKQKSAVPATEKVPLRRRDSISKADSVDKKETPVLKDISLTKTKILSAPKKGFTVGTLVLAKWLPCAKSSRYPAMVKRILPKKQISIKFYDGVKKVVDARDVNRLGPSLQDEARHIWDIMNELHTKTSTKHNEETIVSKISRRLSMKNSRIQQAKMDTAEALLSRLIESAKSNAEKAEKQITVPRVITPIKEKPKYAVPTTEKAPSQRRQSFSRADPVYKTQPSASKDGPSIKTKALSASKKGLNVGTVVLAKWLPHAKSSRYPAMVRRILPKKQIRIQFYDGVKKVVDIKSIMRLEPSLQDEALHIWDIMNELNPETTAEQAANADDSKVSRLESIENARIQQAKMDTAEALLSRLIESAKSGVGKTDRRTARLETSATASVEKKPKSAALTTEKSTPQRRDSISMADLADAKSPIAVDNAPVMNKAFIRFRSASKKGLPEGTVVLARCLTHAKPGKYPSIVKGILPKKKISVLFYDGLEFETDVRYIVRIPASLQKKALHLWKMMNELSIEDTGDSKMGRKSMEATKVQQAKMNKAERLLVKLKELVRIAPDKVEISKPLHTHSTVTLLTKTTRSKRRTSTSMEKPIPEAGSSECRPAVKHSYPKPAVKPFESKSAVKLAEAKTIAESKSALKQSKPKLTGRHLGAKPAGKRSKHKLTAKRTGLKPSPKESEPKPVGKQSEPNLAVKQMEPKMAVKQTEPETGLKQTETKPVGKHSKSKPAVKQSEPKPAAVQTELKPAVKQLEPKLVVMLSDSEAGMNQPEPKPAMKRRASGVASPPPVSRKHRKEGSSFPPTDEAVTRVDEPPTSSVDKPQATNLDAEPIQSHSFVKCPGTAVEPSQSATAKTVPELYRTSDGKFCSAVKKRDALSRPKALKKLLNKRRSNASKKSRLIVAGFSKRRLAKKIKSSSPQAVEMAKTPPPQTVERMKTPPPQASISKCVSIILTPTSSETIDAYSKGGCRADLHKRIKRQSEGETEETEAEEIEEISKPDEPHPVLAGLLSTESFIECEEADPSPADKPISESPAVATSESSHIAASDGEVTIEADKPAPSGTSVAVSGNLDTDAITVDESSPGPSSAPGFRHLLHAVVNLEKKDFSYAVAVSPGDDTKPVSQAVAVSTGDDTKPILQAVAVSLGDDTKPISQAVTGRERESRRGHRAAESGHPRRQSQAASSHKTGHYTIVVEAADAKPAKAFGTEESPNQFQCPQCQKKFRKDALLASHMKYNHSGSPPVPRRRRQNTLSLCSTDSESRAPCTSQAAPPIPPTDPLSLNEAIPPKKQPTRGIQSKAADPDYDPDSDEDSVAASTCCSEVVNCKCGYNEEDDLMIQCDFCCCWQHAECFNFNADELPERYLCFVCLNTPGIRESSRYMYDQSWLRYGSLPELESQTTAGNLQNRKRRKIMKKSQRELQKVQLKLSALGSAKRLLNSAAKGDMYELALWSSDEEISPDSMVEDKRHKLTQQENLLLHVQKVQRSMAEDLDSIEGAVSELEVEAGVSSLRPGEDIASASKNLRTVLDDLKRVGRLGELIAEQEATATSGEKVRSGEKVEPVTTQR